MPPAVGHRMRDCAHSTLLLPASATLHRDCRFSVPPPIRPKGLLPSASRGFPGMHAGRIEEACVPVPSALMRSLYRE